MMKVQNLDENSSVDENSSFWWIFTDFEINQGYKNSYLMKTINCDEHSKLWWKYSNKMKNPHCYELS